MRRTVEDKGEERESRKRRRLKKRCRMYERVKGRTKERRRDATIMIMTMMIMREMTRCKKSSRRNK